AQNHVVQRRTLDAIIQWSSHNVPGSSKKGSQPSSLRSRRPNSEGRIDALAPSRSSKTSEAMHQWRMERTMFFPTPRRVMASSREKIVASLQIASTPFFIHE